MSYDPYADHRRRQAEIQRQESQRSWDRTMRDLRGLGNPPPPAPAGETASGLARFLFFLLVPVVWLAGLVWYRDIARPWSRFRKIVGTVALLASAVGWTGYWLLSPPDEGLAWILGAAANLVLVAVLAPRTVLGLGVLAAVVGIWIEVIAA